MTHFSNFGGVRKDSEAFVSEQFAYLSKPHKSGEVYPVAKPTRSGSVSEALCEETVTSLL